VILLLNFKVSPVKRILQQNTLSQGTIVLSRAGKRWKHLGGYLTKKKHNSKREETGR
jgi:hypothetical protein